MTNEERKKEENGKGGGFPKGPSAGFRISFSKQHESAVVMQLFLGKESPCARETTTQRIESRKEYLFQQVSATIYTTLSGCLAS